jgi:hypothetical protein
VREDQIHPLDPGTEKQTAHAGSRSLTAGAFQPRATPTVRKWDVLTRIERSVSSATMGLELEGSCYWRVLPVVVHPGFPDEPFLVLRPQLQTGSQESGAVPKIPAVLCASAPLRQAVAVSEFRTTRCQIIAPSSRKAAMIVSRAAATSSDSPTSMGGGPFALSAS